MKANFKKYISIALVVCLLMALVSLVACKDKKEPEQTTPSQDVTTTTTDSTTPEETTPGKVTETVTFPSVEENDPKQEDVFFD